MRLPSCAGLSGGIDSALTAALAAEALGPGHVTGVAMPTRYSSAHSLADAETLARNLGIRFHTIPIDAIFQSHLDALAPALPGALGVAEENIQARVRGAVLMAFSNTEGSMLLSTGNKSELAVGYCTLYGDMCGGLAAISDVPKTLVYDLARYVNREREVIPRSSITKAPSAELRPDQTDQDTLPPYEVIDAVIEGYVEKDEDIAGIVAGGSDRAVAESIIGRIDRNGTTQAGRAGLEDHAEGVRGRPALSHRGRLPLARRSEARRAGPRGRPARTVIQRRPRRGAHPRSGARRAAAGAARHALRAVTHRTSPSRTPRRRDLRLGHRAGARRPRAAAHRGSRPVAGTPQIRDEHPRRSRVARVRPDSPSIAALRAPGQCAGRQMDRTERYTDAMVRLTRDGLVYWCDCSRRRVLDESGTVEGELRYGGRCRTRGLGPGPERAARVRLPSGREHFTDARLGEFTHTPAEQCGDLLTQDRLGHWTYQFAVTVDDYVDGVTLVIRGEDLLPSCGRQISLARLLGREERPCSCITLVLGPSGTKLRRRAAIPSLRELRKAVRPEASSRAAGRGLIDHVRPVRQRGRGSLRRSKAPRT
jgi:NAD+ synthetase